MVLPPYGVLRFSGLLRSCGALSLANQSTSVWTFAAVSGAPSAVRAASAQAAASDPVKCVYVASTLRPEGDLRPEVAGGKADRRREEGEGLGEGTRASPAVPTATGEPAVTGSV